MRHFEFTGEEKTIIAWGGNNSKEVKVKRIRSTRDLKYLGRDGFTVHKGEIGGWIEEEDNIQGKRYSAQYKMFVEMVKFQFGVI